MKTEDVCRLCHMDRHDHTYKRFDVRVGVRLGKGFRANHELADPRIICKKYY